MWKKLKPAIIPSHTNIELQGATMWLWAKKEKEEKGYT